MTVDRTTPPPVSPFCDITLPSERVETLDGGTDFHIVSSGEQPILRLTLLWDGGQFDSPSLAEPAITSASMLDQTLTYSQEEIADIVDFNGARLTSRAADHYTGIDLLVLDSHLPRLLPVLKSIVTEARFSAQTIGVRTRKAASARAVQLTRVAFRATTRLQQQLQGFSHPASQLVMPDDYALITPESIDASYARMQAAPLHAFLGGSPSQATVDAVREFLASVPHGNASPIKISPFEAEDIRKTVKIEMPGSQQSAVAMGTTAIPRSHPDYIALRLAVMALGGYFGSRLMHNIREEKGLTYGISSVLYGSREGSYINICAQCDRAHVDSVIEETIHEIERLAAEPPTGDELRRLQMHAWSQLAAATDSSFGILDHYMTRLLVGTPTDYFAAQLHEIEHLTPERIAYAASRYISPSLHTIIAGA